MTRFVRVPVPLIRKQHREFFAELTKLCERYQVHLVGGTVKCFTKKGDEDGVYSVHHASAQGALAVRASRHVNKELWVSGPVHERRKVTKASTRRRKTGKNR